jgi:hypothetical protein
MDKWLTEENFRPRMMEAFEKQLRYKDQEIKNLKEELKLKKLHKRYCSHCLNPGHTKNICCK